ncbi:MAG: FadR/GntR family transcriptional regulator [Geminicoccaceae bacterium]
MVKLSSNDVSALVQLRAYLAQEALPTDNRLPPERELADTLGLSRGELRKALAILEAEGQIWRHVGKGTFVGGPPTSEITNLTGVTASTNPRDVVRARLLIEPELAREAALNATSVDFQRLHECLDASRSADGWRPYENWDNQLHRAIAEATANQALLCLFDTLNAIRRAVVWGRLRTGPAGPSPSHHSFTEHEAIVGAIEQRDREGAARAMRVHLQSVGRHLHDDVVAAE